MSGTEVSMDLTPDELSQDVAYLKSKAFTKELSEGNIVRLIYQGKLLTDDKQLNDLNLQSNPHIHAIVTKINQNGQYSNIEANSVAPARNSDDLKQQILDEIQINLDG
jgi:hypothetical protein